MSVKTHSVSDFFYNSREAADPESEDIPEKSGPDTYIQVS
jgi:hypothetical protein